MTLAFERAVLFDMDGVLVDSFEVWIEVLNATAAALGKPGISREEIVASWGQGIEADVAKYYGGSTVDEVEALFRSFFPAHLEHLIVNEGAHAAVAGLAKRGVGAAVITNTPHRLAVDMLETVDLTPDIIVGGTDVPASKPAPDMVHLACEKLGVPERRTWVVGDSEYDRVAAERAGVRFLGYGGIEADHTLAALVDILAVVDDEIGGRG